MGPSQASVCAFRRLYENYVAATSTGYSLTVQKVAPVSNIDCSYGFSQLVYAASTHQSVTDSFFGNARCSRIVTCEGEPCNQMSIPFTDHVVVLNIGRDGLTTSVANIQ